MLIAALKGFIRSVMRAYRRFTGVDLIDAKLESIRRHNELIDAHLHVLGERLAGYVPAAFDDVPRLRDDQGAGPPWPATKSDEQPPKDVIYPQVDRQEVPWETLYAISEKLDVLLLHRYSTDRTDLHISREIDRLDGYLQYHVETVLEDLKLLRNCKSEAKYGEGNSGQADRP